MKHLLLSTAALALAITMLMPHASSAAILPSDIAALDSSAKADTAVTTAKNALLADTLGAAETDLTSFGNSKDIGGGYSLTDLGTIVKKGTTDPIAMLDGSGNVVEIGEKKLEATTRSALNKLVKGISFPAGINLGSRTDSRFIQKNVYIAASENPDVYYGGFGGLNVNSIIAAIVKGATSSGGGPAPAPGPVGSATGIHIQPGTNQVVDGSGTVLATYNPTTGEFTGPTGAVIPTTDPQYANLSAALSIAVSGT